MRTTIVLAALTWALLLVPAQAQSIHQLSYELDAQGDGFRATIKIWPLASTRGGVSGQPLTAMAQVRSGTLGSLRASRWYGSGTGWRTMVSAQLTEVTRPQPAPVRPFRSRGARGLLLGEEEPLPGVTVTVRQVERIGMRYWLQADGTGRGFFQGPARKYWFSLQRVTVLPTDPGYQALSGAEKQRILFEILNTNRYTDLPTRRDARESRIRRAVLNRGPQPEATSDVRQPAWRERLPLGAAAKVELRIPTRQYRLERYTGVFGSGAPGIVRLGWDLVPGEEEHEVGAEVKLFVDGRPAVTLAAGARVTTPTPFLADSPPPPPALGTLFSRPLGNTYRDPLARVYLSSVERDGTLVGPPRRRTPFRIWLSPGASLRALPPAHDFRLQLMGLEPGSVLYRVWDDHPSEGYALGHDKRSRLRPFAEIVLTSRFVASDEVDRLFHAHVVAPPF